MTKAQSARIFSYVEQLREALPDAAAALDAYAEARGKDWPELLMLDWWKGTDDRFTSKNGQHLGHQLRQIRNHPKWGPSFYKAFNGED